MVLFVIVDMKGVTIGEGEEEENGQKSPEIPRVHMHFGHSITENLLVSSITFLSLRRSRRPGVMILWSRYGGEEQIEACRNVLVDGTIFGISRASVSMACMGFFHPISRIGGEQRVSRSLIPFMLSPWPLESTFKKNSAQECGENSDSATQLASRTCGAPLSYQSSNPG